MGGGQKWARAGRERACTVNPWGFLYLPLWVSQRLRVSTRHRVRSNFLRVMEVITARAPCSDWSLLVTVGWCEPGSVGAGSVILCSISCTLRVMSGSMCQPQTDTLIIYSMQEIRSTKLSSVKWKILLLRESESPLISVSLNSVSIVYQRTSQHALLKC